MRDSVAGPQPEQARLAFRLCPSAAPSDISRTQRDQHRRQNAGGPPQHLQSRPPGSHLAAAFSFFIYSGYIVSAPPRAASKGIFHLSANSCRNGFSPGRKLGTLVRSALGSSSTYSQGHSQLPPEL